MENLEDKAQLVNKTGEKILRLLKNLDEPSAFSVINYCFTLMVIDDQRGPIVAKAMVATFSSNVVNSINGYFHDGEEESVH